MSETELLKSFTEHRSESAFAELVRRYAGLVYSTAKRRLANTSLAEDITQIVFIRLAKNPPRVRTQAELTAWLHRTTVNVTIDVWRSENRRRARELHAAVMEPSDTAPAIIWEEISPRLDEALNELKDDDRQAILLRFISQKTMREVGAALGISEDAAKMRVSRAVDRLRTQLGARVAACSVVLLGTLLVEHTAQAVPAPLLAKLSALKLSATAGTGASVGTFISPLKLACGAAALALLTLGTIHFIHPRNTDIFPFTAKGTVVTEIFQPGETNPTTSNQFDFTFIYSNQCWTIESRYPNPNRPGHFVIESYKRIPDGVRFFVVDDDYQAAAAATGTKKRLPWATAASLAFPAPEQAHLFTCWLCLCPHPELPLIDSKRMRRLLSSKLLARSDNQGQYTATYLSSQQAFLSSLTIDNDGTIYMYDGSVRNLPSPFDQGYTEFKYEVTDVTTVNGIQFPSQAMLAKYEPIQTQAASREDVYPRFVTSINIKQITAGADAAIAPPKLVALGQAAAGEGLPDEIIGNRYITNDIWPPMSSLQLPVK